MLRGNRQSKLVFEQSYDIITIITILSFDVKLLKLLGGNKVASRFVSINLNLVATQCSLSGFT